MTGSRWCSVCGFDHEPEGPALPTPDALDAARREADWLSRHPEASREAPDEVAEHPAQAWADWPAGPPPAAPAFELVQRDEGPRRRRQRRGIALIAAGFVIVAVSTYFSILQPLLVSVDRFDAPGGVDERLDEGDERSIYIQTEGSRYGYVDAGPFGAEELGCTVRDTATATTVRVEPIADHPLKENEDAYVAKLEFRAPRTASYRVECVPATGLGTPVPLALGPRIYLWRYAIIFLAGLIACGVLTLIGAVMVSRARSR